MTDERNGNGLIPRLDFFKAMVLAGNFSRTALRVAYMLLYQHLNGMTGRCDPAQATLAKEIGLSEGAVKRAIHELEESGWWTVGHQEGTTGLGGRTNTYRPNFKRGLKTDPPLEPKEDSKPAPLSNERGLNPALKEDSKPTPKPGKNQEEDSDSVDRSATDPVSELSRFDDFWRAYPSRAPHSNPKKPAREKFAAALKRGADPAAIIRGAKNYAVEIAANRLAANPRRSSGAGVEVVLYRQALQTRALGRSACFQCHLHGMPPSKSAGEVSAGPRADEATRDQAIRGIEGYRPGTAACRSSRKLTGVAQGISRKGADKIAPRRSRRSPQASCAGPRPICRCPREAPTKDT